MQVLLCGYQVVRICMNKNNGTRGNADIKPTLSKILLHVSLEAILTSLVAKGRGERV